jgi:hypothetical protein
MAGGRHTDAWIKHKGSGPWPCDGCGEPVERLGGSTTPTTGIVHHVDENPRNNDIANLRAMHHACHVAHHNGKRIVSPESRARMSAAQKRRRANEPPEVRDRFVRSMTGKAHTAEVRRKISVAQRGKTVSQDTRGRISEGLRGNKNSQGRPMSEETRRKIADSLLGRKHTPEAIKNITVANRRIAKTRRPRSR